MNTSRIKSARLYSVADPEGEFSNTTTWGLCTLGHAVNLCKRDYGTNRLLRSDRGSPVGNVWIPNTLKNGRHKFLYYHSGRGLHNAMPGILGANIRNMPGILEGSICKRGCLF